MAPTEYIPDPGGPVLQHPAVIDFDPGLQLAAVAKSASRAAGPIDASWKTQPSDVQNHASQTLKQSRLSVYGRVLKTVEKGL